MSDPRNEMPKGKPPSVVAAVEAKDTVRVPQITDEQARFVEQVREAAGKYESALVVGGPRRRDALNHR